MIVPPGVLIPMHRTRLLAAGLRLVAEKNGGLPAWAHEQLAELDAAALSVATSADGSTEPPMTPARRTLSNVTFVGTKLAAERLGVSDRYVRDLCESGELEAERVGRRWLIAEPALDVYQQRRNG